MGEDGQHALDEHDRDKGTSQTLVMSFHSSVFTFSSRASGEDGQHAYEHDRDKGTSQTLVMSFHSMFLLLVLGRRLKNIMSRSAKHEMLTSCQLLPLDHTSLGDARTN